LRGSGGDKGNPFGIDGGKGEDIKRIKVFSSGEGENHSFHREKERL